MRVLLADRPCWLAASTHPGEEAIIFHAHRLLIDTYPRLITIIVPRHPERGAQIVREATGLQITRRSVSQHPPTRGVWVADTLGELGLWYRLAGIALIGRSLIPPGGGQNPLEAARLACAVAVGPHTGNFIDAVQVLDRAGALARVTDGPSIAAWVGTILGDPARRAECGVLAAAAAGRFADLPRQIATELLALMPTGAG